jgi:hypothetical protein
MLEIESFFFRCTTKYSHDHIIRLLLHILSEKVLIYKIFWDESHFSLWSLLKLGRNYETHIFFGNPVMNIIYVHISYYFSISYFEDEFVVSETLPKLTAKNLGYYYDTCVCLHCYSRPNCKTMLSKLRVLLWHMYVYVIVVIQYQIKKLWVGINA